LEWGPSPHEFGTLGEGTRKAVTPMAIVWSCALGVDAYSAQGRGVEVPRPCCPGCGASMIFWSGYDRPVRCRATFKVWVRRARCKACRASHALLPSFLLVRRLDGVEVIGPTIEAVACGAGTRSSARRAGVPHTTARSWWRRHRARTAVATAVLAWLGCPAGPGGAAAGLVALAPPGEPWRWRGAAVVCGGGWLLPCHHHLAPAQSGNGVV
jgi:hypothetical protein